MYSAPGDRSSSPMQRSKPAIGCRIRRHARCARVYAVRIETYRRQRAQHLRQHFLIPNPFGRHRLPAPNSAVIARAPPQPLSLTPAAPPACTAARSAAVSPSCTLPPFSPLRFPSLASPLPLRALRVCLQQYHPHRSMHGFGCIFNLHTPPPMCLAPAASSRHQLCCVPHLSAQHEHLIPSAPSARRLLPFHLKYSPFLACAPTATTVRPAPPRPTWNRPALCVAGRSGFQISALSVRRGMQRGPGSSAAISLENACTHRIRLHAGVTRLGLYTRLDLSSILSYFLFPSFFLHVSSKYDTSCAMTSSYVIVGCRFRFEERESKCKHRSED
jgi:hypothetical protein